MFLMHMSSQASSLFSLVSYWGPSFILLFFVIDSVRLSVVGPKGGVPVAGHVELVTSNTQAPKVTDIPWSRFTIRDYFTICDTRFVIRDSDSRLVTGGVGFD